VTPLPASVAARCITVGAALGARARAPLLRALLYTALSFLTLMRASSAVSLARADVELTARDIVVRPTVIKNGGLLPELPKPKKLPRHRLPELQRLLEAWQASQRAAYDAARVTMPPAADLQSFWLLPGEVARGAAATGTEWILMACAHLHAAPPFGGKYTSHCLRKGGTSAAFAIGVTLEDICDLGDWALQSPVPERHYIDRSILACDAARLLFGHLKRT
jgi:integrase